MRILMVCLGNICRSPTAEGVMRGLVDEGEITVESAGTGGWHVGEPRDARSVAAARRQGVELVGVARQVTPSDFDRYDLLIAMDRSNARDLVAMAPDERAAAKVRLLREFDADSVRAGTLDVPDPYYGGSGGFDAVVEIVQAGCEGLLAHVRAQAA